MTGVPADVAVQCNAVPAVAVVTAADQCDTSPSLAFNASRLDGACADRYVLVRTWTSGDVCGNNMQSVQTITVQVTLLLSFISLV